MFHKRNIKFVAKTNTVGSDNRSFKGSQVETHSLPGNEPSNLGFQNLLLMIMFVHLALFSASKTVLSICYTEEVRCQVEA